MPCRKTAIGTQLSVLGHEALYLESRRPLPAESRQPNSDSLRFTRQAASLLKAKQARSGKDEVEAYPSIMRFSDSYSALENTVRGDTVGQ